MRNAFLLLIAFILNASGFAATQRVTGSITFSQAIELTVNNALQFGSVDTSLATLSHSITLSTSDVLSDSYNHTIPSSTRTAASVGIIADSSKTLQIAITNVVQGQYFSLSNFTCKYNNNAAKNCSVGTSITETAVYSGTLKIGATLTGNGTTPAEGADTATFTLEVVYL